MAFDAHDENHHLWRNGRLWWVAFTVHLPTWQKERVRVSLGTGDLAEARRRRDALFQSYPDGRGATLSLRAAPPRRRTAMRDQASPAAAAAQPFHADGVRVDAHLTARSSCHHRAARPPAARVLAHHERRPLRQAGADVGGLSAAVSGGPT